MVGNLLDKLRKLYMNGMGIWKFLAVLNQQRFLGHVRFSEQIFTENSRWVNLTQTPYEHHHHRHHHHQLGFFKVPEKQRHNFLSFKTLSTVCCGLKFGNYFDLTIEPGAQISDKELLKIIFVVTTLLLQNLILSYFDFMQITCVT